MALQVVAEPPQTRRSLIAALLLLARELLPNWSGWPATASGILALVGAGRSQAYEMLERLRNLLPTLIAAPGRPPAVSVSDATRSVGFAVRDYLLNHPGAVSGTDVRRTYTDHFRRFVVAVCAPLEGVKMALTEMQEATGLPAGTLKEWLQLGRSSTPAPTCDSPDDVEDPSISTTIRSAHMQLIAGLWVTWEGTFSAFCNMLRTEQKIPYGDTHIGSILGAVGLRQRNRRLPVEAPWSSNTFRKHFPGVQWIGDGTSIIIYWEGQPFVFNVEALIDNASNALLGLTVSDTEDEEALRLAYEASLATTGAPPIAVTLDNRPSNHSPAALESLSDTTVLRSTPARGQSKAPVEGTFGLFEQSMPPLEITGNTPREKARSALYLIFVAWARGRNGRPRKQLNGQTPADAYKQARPTEKELEEARAYVQQLLRRQERARLTREARRDPVRLGLLTQGLAELGIADPDRRLAIALAGYAREAIARGLATFRSKQELGTVPPDADPGRYLGGIIRQLNTRLELEHTAVHLLEQRLRLRDLSLEPLQRLEEQTRTEQSAATLPQVFVDRALEATCEVDFRFWSLVAADALSMQPADVRTLTYHFLCRRIAASFKTERRRREDLIDRLAAIALPP